MEDFDTLMENARNSKRKEDDFELWRKLFELEHWIVIPVGEEMKWRPFIGVIDDITFLPVFTDHNKAFDFAYRNKIKEEKNQGRIMTMSPRSIVDWAKALIEMGVVKIVVNDSWSLKLKDLNDLYYYLMKPNDFKMLVAEANKEGNVEGLMALWKATFDLPKWFFIGDMKGKKNQTFLTQERSGLVLHAFISLEAAQKELELLKKNPAFSAYHTFMYEPAQAFHFVNHLEGKGVLGIMFHDEFETTYGVSIAKLNKIKQIQAQVHPK